MPKRSSPPDYCGIARAMEILGEWWTILIIRDAFHGITHFDEFQRSLGIARNVLAARLTRLVDAGVFTRTPSAEDRRCVEYRLTEKGRDLFTALVALSQWGERWLRRADEPLPFALVDSRDRQPLARVEVRASDGRRVGSEDVELIPGPGLTDAVRRSVPALRVSSDGVGNGRLRSRSKAAQFEKPQLVSEIPR